MNRFTFKLSVQPSILEKFQKHELINKMIPEKIYSTYNDIFCTVIDNTETLDFVIKNEYIEAFETEAYSTLLSETNEFITEYIKITREYRQKNGLNYNQDFLDKSDHLIEKRKDLFKLYPILSDSNNFIDNKSANDYLENMYDFEIDNKVGIGIDHIRRVQKLKLFAEEIASRESTPVNVTYNLKRELIIISSDNQKTAFDISREIEAKINRKKDELGSITINPVFEVVKLDTRGNPRSIEVIVVYPNGLEDELKAILLDGLRTTNAKESRNEFVASENVDSNIFIDNVMQIVNEPAKKGYIRDIKSNNTSIIDFTKSKIKKDK